MRTTSPSNAPRPVKTTEQSERCRSDQRAGGDGTWRRTGYWTAYRRRSGGGKEAWLRERFLRHRGGVLRRDPARRNRRSASRR